MENNIALEFYLNSTPNDRLNFLLMIQKDITIPIEIEGGTSVETLWEENPICLNGTSFQLNTEEFGKKISNTEDDDLSEIQHFIVNKPVKWLFPKSVRNQSPSLSSRVCNAINWRVHYNNGDAVNTIGDLIQHSRFDIIKWKHIGKKGLAFIQDSLAKHELYLKGE